MEFAVDTLKIYDRLRHEGAFDEKAARAVTGVFQEILDSELVRKGKHRTESDKIRLEMEKMRTELTREIEQVRADLALEITQVRSEVENLRIQIKADIETAKFETIKWTIGLLLAQTGILISAIKLLR